MKIIFPFIRIVRFGNVIMAGFAVFLGSWLSGTLRWPQVSLLMVAAMSSTGFGNVINDLRDVHSDRINHPRRPLPQNQISVPTASAFAVFLMITAIAAAAGVSFFYIAATIVPIALLCIYSLYLKSIPLAGNFLVATLVAYAFLFAALPQSQRTILIIPATLAFLLNLCREIVKDIQDSSGDIAQGVKTSAILPPTVLKAVLISSAIIYLSLLFLPSVLGHFRTIYIAIALFVIIPIHMTWIKLVLCGQLISKTPQISNLLKIEMIAGLVAMAADKLV